VEGAAFDEAKAINQSLTTLGRCIEVLASNKKEKPPFRESKLTRLLSNAIGGGAKTCLIICVAPTIIDQIETVGSLEFGQQAMNVVVRAKVNASTDYGSLCASLLAQKDKKQRPIRELELSIIKGFRPKLDQVIELELECKKGAATVEAAEERLETEKDKFSATLSAKVAEEEADKVAMVEQLNEKAKQTQELEKVLVQLSTDPEMKSIQEEHEAEKASVMERSMVLQEEVRAAEGKEQKDRQRVDGLLEGIIHTARNLGQIACFFLQTGMMDEAADFYMQAKAIFDKCLGPSHPKTQAWQEDLFFLINAPAIQSMVKEAAKAVPRPDGASATGPGVDDVDTASQWWMQNLFEMNSRTADEAPPSDEAASSDWWMRNIFDFGSNRELRGEPDENVDYMDVIFGTPRADGTTTPRGGPAFTPRGTLVAVSHAYGKAGAARSLGMPMLKKQSGISEGHQPGAGGGDGDEDGVSLTFAKDWVQKVFQTPRGVGDSNEEIESNMADAVLWLQENFGATPRGEGAGQAQSVTTPTQISTAQFTPRGKSCGSGAASEAADDAVLRAAMQAALATPRGAAENVRHLDDTPMVGAVNKMFKGLQHV